MAPEQRGPTLTSVVTDLLIGQVIAGRYVVQERIGDGGMGVVYKARQLPIDRAVALKVLLPEAAEKDRTVSRFLTEARIISQLRHPNTVKLIDFGHTGDGRLFMAMEYIEGGQLRDLLSGRRLDQVAALRLGQQICHALAEAHSLGIVHRDLKPENVLLERIHGAHLMVKVVDFGVAKLLAPETPASPEPVSPFSEAELTLPGTRLGTPVYMAPEQAFARELDGRADLYAVGVLLYEMISGHAPFDHEDTTGLCLEHLHTPPRPLREALPELGIDPEVDALILKLLAKSPDERPRSAEAVVHEMERLLARLGTVAPPTAGDSVDTFEAQDRATWAPLEAEDSLDTGFIRRRRRVLVSVLVAGAIIAAATVAAAFALFH